MCPQDTATPETYERDHVDALTLESLLAYVEFAREHVGPRPLLCSMSLVFDTDDKPLLVNVSRDRETVLLPHRGLTDLGEWLGEMRERWS